MTTPTPARARGERIQFRTTSETFDLVMHAVTTSGTTITDFAESSLVEAAQRVLADRQTFELSPDALAAWERVNDRPARSLPGLRRLMERPSPFGE